MGDVRFDLVARAFADQLKRRQWVEDPVLWATDHDLFLWSKQREVMRSVAANKKTLVITGNGVGKSRLASTAVVWWVDVHDPHETTVVTTATNWRQVSNILWKEIPRVKETAGSPGRITANAEWKVQGRKDPVAFGMKPDDKDESGFQGVHDEHVLVVLDEAGGISKEIFTAADAIATNDHARILAIANPNDPNCYMAEIYHKEMALPPEQRTWYIIQFGAFDTPNFTGEKVPEKVASRLVQQAWVEDKKKAWGESDPRYVSRVLGQFPEISDDGLFNLGKVTIAMIEHTEDQSEKVGPVRLGVDVARYGSDDSVIVSYCQGRVEIIGRYQGKSGPELARLIGKAVEETGATEVNIDGVGVGVSVLDNIHMHVPGNVVVRSILGNAASPNKEKWYNWRAASYEYVSDLINQGKLQIPQDDDLYAQFRSIKYIFKGSALQLRSKEDMRRKGDKSPDILDAVVYAVQDVDAMQFGAGGEDSLITSEDILGVDEFDDMMLYDVFLA